MDQGVCCLEKGYFEYNDFHMDCGFGGEGIVTRVWGRREAEVPRLVSTFSGLNFRSATWMSSTVASSAVFPDLPHGPYISDSQVSLSPGVEELGQL